MNKIFTLRCPKEDNKQYFSLEKHQYQNNLTVMVNDMVVFENINDAEENLPIVLSDQVLFDPNSGCLAMKWFLVVVFCCNFLFRS